MIELLRGDRRGVGPAALRSLLWWGQWPYIAAVAWRNRRFDRGQGVSSVTAPVVSIGNITTGGTGKTPAVAWLCRYLRDRGVRVAILSRGYGAGEGGVNDEALELEQRLPDVPHLQNPDRIQSAAVACEELESRFLVLDDGFQHRRLSRDLDWVLIDALNPFGYGHCLPRGLLREPIRGLRRADAILVTRANQVPPAQLHELLNEITQVVEHRVPIVRTIHQAEGWLAHDGTLEPLDKYQSSPVAAFCGIGNPDAFQSTLAGLGCDVRQWRTFPDHHRFDRDDLKQLQAWASEAGEITAVVCTAKDLVKLNLMQLAGRPLRALQIGFEFLDDPQRLLNQLGPLVDQALADEDESSLFQSPSPGP